MPQLVESSRGHGECDWRCTSSIGCACAHCSLCFLRVSSYVSHGVLVDKFHLAHLIFAPIVRRQGRISDLNFGQLSLSHLNKACLSKGMASFTQDKTRPVRCLENSTARQQNTGRPLQCAFGSSDSGQGVGTCFLEVDLLCHCVVGCRA